MSRFGLTERDEEELRENHVTGGVDPGHRILNESEKMTMSSVKDHGERFMEVLIVLENKNPTLEIQQAKFRLQEAIMWAVKHVTR